MPAPLRFFELAPENRLEMGGQSARDLRAFPEASAFVYHGLSLSLGGPFPLNVTLLARIKAFMREHGIGLYTEHRSWCADDAYLHDILPIPLTIDAVRWVAARIRHAQDMLGMRIGIENAPSYFVPPGAEMSEAEFVNVTVAEADCALHLDVNNIYVNGLNLGFDAHEFVRVLPLDRVCYVYVAGHYVEPDGLVIDTHSADVIDPVWALPDAAYTRIGGEVPALSAIATSRRWPRSWLKWATSIVADRPRATHEPAPDEDRSFFSTLPARIRAPWSIGNCCSTT